MVLTLLDHLIAQLKAELNQSTYACASFTPHHPPPPPALFPLNIASIFLTFATGKHSSLCDACLPKSIGTCSEISLLVQAMMRKQGQQGVESVLAGSEASLRQARLGSLLRQSLRERHRVCGCWTAASITTRRRARQRYQARPRRSSCSRRPRRCRSRSTAWDPGEMFLCSSLLVHQVRLASGGRD